MKYYNVGNTIKASSVIMGCMRLQNLSQKDANAMIDHALSLGIDFFDHADIYGGGKCEEMFGEYLKANPQIREKITIQTKCAIRSGYYDFSKEHILKSVDKSLNRLKTDYIDVLLLHRPDSLMEPEEVAEAFNSLHNSGKVRNFGVSNHNPMQIELLKTEVKQPIIVNQLQFSVTECGMVSSGMNVNMKNDESNVRDGSVLEYSRINKITIQAWSPFQKGFFDGPFIGDTEEYPELNKKLDEIAEKYGVDSTAIASAWILRHPAHIQLIAGTMNKDRLTSICKGADITLTRPEWYGIYEAAGYCIP